MNPLYQLKAVARQLESEGRYALARQLVRAEKQARVLTGASDEVMLESWSDFENWFLKNRAQGLEFVAEDKWGADSAEAQAFKDILEGYDLIERKLHELYVMLRGDAEAQPVVEEEEEVEPEPADALDEAAADLASEEAPVAEPGEEVAEEVVEEEPASEEAADELGTEEDDETVSEGEAEEETPEEPTEEEVAGKEASTSPEAKMIKRIQKLMRRGNVNSNSIIFRGNGTYRVLCANSEDGDNATKFFTDKGWDLKREDHVTGRVFVDVTP